jgi:hypothetical protein
VSRRKIRRRGRRAKRTRRPLTLTAWRAVIVGQAMRDLARHGLGKALGALVLSAETEARDMQHFAELMPGGLAERAVRGKLEHDKARLSWQWVAEAFGRPGPLDEAQP